jgi:hypothetical protein
MYDPISKAEDARLLKVDKDVEACKQEVDDIQQKSIDTKIKLPPAVAIAIKVLILLMRIAVVIGIFLLLIFIVAKWTNTIT